jgi:hypothetical protein
MKRLRQHVGFIRSEAYISVLCTVWVPVQEYEGKKENVAEVHRIRKPVFQIQLVQKVWMRSDPRVSKNNVDSRCLWYSL